MKKLMVLSAIAITGLMAQPAKAQFGIHINLHLGARPEIIEPAPVYADDYYYLPDVEAYYSVSENCYYYNDGYNWVSAAYLPGAYRDYDWRYARRIEIKEPRAYLHNDVYRERYAGFEHRNWNYRDQHDDRMYADRNHDHFNNNRDNRQMQEPQRNQPYYGDNRNRDQRSNNDRQQAVPQGNTTHSWGQPQAQTQQPNNPDRGNNNGNNRGQQAQQQPQTNPGNGSGYGRGQQAQPQTNPGNGSGYGRGQQQGNGGSQQSQPAQQSGHANGNSNGGTPDRFARNTITDPIRTRPVRN